MKYLQYIVVVISPLVIFLTIFNFYLFDTNWYNNEFLKLGVYQNIPQERIQAQIKNLFDYFKNIDTLDKNFYTQRELFHLVDLKKIYGVEKFINLLAVTFLIISLLLTYLKLGRKKLIKNIFTSALFSLLVYFSLTILLLFYFDQIFLLFHKIAFANNFWQLDPQFEKLIIIFPPALFADLIGKIILISSVVILIIIIISFLFFLNKSGIIKKLIHLKTK